MVDRAQPLTQDSMPRASGHNSHPGPREGKSLALRYAGAKRLIVDLELGMGLDGRKDCGAGEPVKTDKAWSHGTAKGQPDSVSP